MDSGGRATTPRRPALLLFLFIFFSFFFFWTGLYALRISTGVRYVSAVPRDATYRAWLADQHGHGVACAHKLGQATPTRGRVHPFGYHHPSFTRSLAILFFHWMGAMRSMACRRRQQTRRYA